MLSQINFMCSLGNLIKWLEFIIPNPWRVMKVNLAKLFNMFINLKKSLKSSIIDLHKLNHLTKQELSTWNRKLFWGPKPNLWTTELYLQIKNKAAKTFLKELFYVPYFLVALVTECNFDLSSGLPETRENWQLCQIVQQKSLLPLHYGRNFQVLSRNYFIFTNELIPEIREQMPGPKIW